MGFHEFERQREAQSPVPECCRLSTLSTWANGSIDFFQLSRGHADPRIHHRQVDRPIRMPVRRDPDRRRRAG